MNINITFRHMDHTPALDQMIREKSEKFNKWFSGPFDVRWTCWVEGINHCSEVSIQSGAKEFFAKAHSEDLYKTLDQVVSKIQNQLM